jgi:hypothetical protein
MEAISRRLWLTWGAVACGATACGCRAPGLGELPLSRTFSDPQFNTAPESNTGDGEQSLPAASSSDEPGGVNLTLGDQPAAASWTDNYEEALAQAAAGGKLVLASPAAISASPACGSIRKSLRRLSFKLGPQRDSCCLNSTILVGPHSLLPCRNKIDNCSATTAYVLFRQCSSCLPKARPSSKVAHTAEEVRKFGFAG